MCQKPFELAFFSYGLLTIESNYVSDKICKVW